jgi:protein-S-isoprenylcysteine O-methyltransferase Ste14
MNLENSTPHHQRGHKNRPDLTGEHRFGDAGQLILIIVFLAVWILDSFVFKYSTFLNINIKWYFLVIPGVIILAISQYIAVSGVKIVFGEIRETPRVITKGVFSFVRHPVYLGSILAFLGLIVMTLSLLSVIIWLIGIIFYYRISRYEERLLLSRFGKEYEDYMKKVPMLFPLKFR